jgi:hypothetical protein
MAKIKISALPSASTINDADVLPLVQSGVTKKSSVSLLKTVFGSAITASNGLTKTVNNIALGGALTANTSITGATFNFDIGTSGSRIGALTNYSATYTLDTTGIVNALSLGGFNLIERGTTNFILENQDGSAVMQTRLNVSLSEWWDAKSVKTGLYYMGFGEASNTDFTLADYSSIPLGALTPKKEVNRLIDLAIVNKANNYTASSYASWAKTLETDYVIDTEASPTTGAVTLAISLTGAKEGKKVTWFVNPSSFTMSVTAGTLKRLGTGEVVLNRINIIELYYAGGYVYYFVTSPTTLPYQYRPFLFDLTDEMFPGGSRQYANVLTGTGNFSGVNPQVAYANRQGLTTLMAGATVASGVALRIGRGASSGTIGNFFVGAGFVVFTQDRFLLPAISDGTQRINVKSGWFDYDLATPGANCNAMTFNYRDTENSGKISFNIHKNTSTPAVIDTNITPTAGKWYRTLIIVNKDGTKIKAYLFDDDTYDNNTALFETTIDSSGYLSIWNGTPQALVTSTKSTDCPVGSGFPHGRGVSVYRTVGNVNQALLVVDQMSTYALAEATI